MIFELLYRGNDCIDCLFVKVDSSGRSLIQASHSLESAAFRESYDWRAASLSFYGDNSEVFLGRKNERFRLSYLRSQHVAGLVSHQRDIAARGLTSLLIIRTLANDDKVLIWHLGESFDDQRNLLVRHHSGCRNIIILLFIMGFEKTKIYRRVDDLCFEAIGLLIRRATKAELAIIRSGPWAVLMSHIRK